MDDDVYLRVANEIKTENGLIVEYALPSIENVDYFGCIRTETSNVKEIIFLASDSIISTHSEEFPEELGDMANFWWYLPVSAVPYGRIIVHTTPGSETCPELVARTFYIDEENVDRFYDNYNYIILDDYLPIPMDEEFEIQRSEFIRGMFVEDLKNISLEVDGEHIDINDMLYPKITALRFKNFISPRTIKISGAGDYAWTERRRRVAIEPGRIEVLSGEGFDPNNLENKFYCDCCEK